MLKQGTPGHWTLQRLFLNKRFRGGLWTHHWLLGAGKEVNVWVIVLLKFVTEEKLFVLKDPSALGPSTFLRSLEGEGEDPHSEKLPRWGGYLPHNKAGYNSPEATLQLHTGNKSTTYIASYVSFWTNLQNLQCKYLYLQFNLMRRHSSQYLSADLRSSCYYLLVSFLQRKTKNFQYVIMTVQ